MALKLKFWEREEVVEDDEPFDPDSYEPESTGGFGDPGKNIDKEIRIGVAGMVFAFAAWFVLSNLNDLMEVVSYVSD